MTLMALDLSLTNAGIVVLDSGSLDVLHTEVVGYPLKNSDPPSVQVGRMLSIAKTVVRIAREHGVGHAVAEGPAFSRNGRVFELGGLHYVVMSQLRLALDVAVDVIPPTEARKKVLGRGSPPKGKKVKPWVKATLKSMYGIDMGNEHLSDAMVVAMSHTGIRKIQTLPGL